jgi:iron complex outermembrane receptor protein
MLQRLLAGTAGLILGIGLSMIFASSAEAGPEDSLSTSALKRRPLEELMDIDVTLVAKRPQRWFDAQAAVYVISGEDIRRSGARSIPEALRLAPNLNVAQIDSRQWAISSRGFNSSSSNKLLVLIDGRIVYTTLYSGVFWDVQEVLLNDVDRIEVISGPGGTLWGTNAVNGIINIMMKSSGATRLEPLHVEAGGGIGEKLSGAVRYSGSVGSDVTYSAYAKYFDRGESHFATNGSDGNDSWTGVQGGFRTDGELSWRDSLTLQGDAYRNRANQYLADMATMEGGNVLARWRHSLSDFSSFTLQSYFDYTHRRMPGVFGEDRRVFDHEFDYLISWTPHEVSWGIGVRHGNSQVQNSAVLAFLPAFADGVQYSAYVQDIYTLTDRVSLTFGSKFVKVSNSDFEFQPRLSLGWAPDPQEFLWSSVTRAVRTPSRLDRNLYSPGAPPYLLAGGPDFISEKLIAIEAGYRNKSSQNVILDISLFYNLYDDIRSVEPGPPYTIKNGLEAKTFGGELALTTQIRSWWRVKTGYSHLEKFISLKPWSMDVNGGLGEGDDHKHRVVIESSMDFMKWELDLFFRYVDKLPNSNAFVPSYSTLDSRLGWNPTQILSFSVLVQNIFLPEHVEFGPPANRKEIGREVFGRVSVSF